MLFQRFPSNISEVLSTNSLRRTRNPRHENKCQSNVQSYLHDKMHRHHDSRFHLKHIPSIGSWEFERLKFRSEVPDLHQLLRICGHLNMATCNLATATFMIRAYYKAGALHLSASPCTIHVYYYFATAPVVMPMGDIADISQKSERIAEAKPRCFLEFGQQIDYPEHIKYHPKQRHTHLP